MRPTAPIENPILNSPFVDPTRHFEMTDEGITGEVRPGRRPSSFLVPIPPPKKKKGSSGLLFKDDGPREERKSAEHINQLREVVRLWRGANYDHRVSPRTRRLLEHWFRDDRDPRQRLFFGQREAIETAIFLHETTRKIKDRDKDRPVAPSERKMLDLVLSESRRLNAGLERIAFRMATGTGKTNVMAMLIAWMTLNHVDDGSEHYARNFLVVAPGVTIRDRLQVLRPEHPDNAYRRFDLVPEELIGALREARVEVINYHALARKTHTEVARVTRGILANGDAASPFEETFAQMVERVCRPFPEGDPLVVINDEAHHCYLKRKVENRDPEDDLKGDDKKDAKRENEKAERWISGLLAIKAHRPLRAVYDLSATPQFLRGSGHAEGTLFPWVVSDFNLVEAIESGIVKVPAVPVDDDRVAGDAPVDRNLWEQTRDWWKSHDLYDAKTGEPQVPDKVELALRRLYDQYATDFNAWQDAARKNGHGFIAPPVFIVVCANTRYSKLLYDLIAGYKHGDGWREGRLPLFSNVDAQGRPLARPNTILVDSEQLESDEAISDDFRKAAEGEIEAFKRELRRMKGAAAVEKLTDGDLLREVLNTVGRRGRLGEQVRCVVSVSMLTEGWDANTVTHVFGLRAFSSQLLCEQVVGRGLRRMDFTLDTEDHFKPEKVDVYGIPFEFVPCTRIDREPPPPVEWYEVKNDPARVAAKPALRVEFPRVLGYRNRLPEEHLGARFTADHRLVLSTEDLATHTDVSTLIGHEERHSLDGLRARRAQEVVYYVAKHLLEQHFAFTDADTGRSHPKVWLLPQALDVTRRWINTCVEPFLKDGTFVQLLLVREKGVLAAEKIASAIALAHSDVTGVREVNVLLASSARGSTDGLCFETTRPRYATRPDKCPITHVVADTDAWEQKVAQSLEDMPEVTAYVKNDHHLGLFIPYTHEGVERRYLPDFVVKYNDGADDALHVLVELTGQKRADKAAKVATARDTWVPAVNHHGGFGRWAFVEVRDAANAQTEIREALRALQNSSAG